MHFLEDKCCTMLRATDVPATYRGVYTSAAGSGSSSGCGAEDEGQESSKSFYFFNFFKFPFFVLSLETLAMNVFDCTF